MRRGILVILHSCTPALAQAASTARVLHVTAWQTQPGDTPLWTTHSTSRSKGYVAGAGYTRSPCAAAAARVALIASLGPGHGRPASRLSCCAADSIQPTSSQATLASPAAAAHAWQQRTRLARPSCCCEAAAYLSRLPRPRSSSDALVPLLAAHYGSTYRLLASTCLAMCSRPR
jgi:hypothetical protein